MTNRQRLTLAATFIIMLGLAPSPRAFFAHTLSSPRGFAALPFTFDLIALAPFLPFVITLAAAIANIRLPRGFALLTIAIGVPCTLGAAAVSGPGGLHVLILGAATTLAIAGAIAATARIPGAAGPRRFALICLGLALAAAIWSLAAVGVVAAGAQNLANGRPFCVAHHGKDAEVTGIADLRGLRFFTTRAGHKDSSRWYFHGLLLIDGPDGVAAWNWSPRALAFHPLRRVGRTTPVDDACTPRHGFWRGVGLF
jgi:hypothetical protein